MNYSKRIQSNCLVDPQKKQNPKDQKVSRNKHQKNKKLIINMI